MWYKWTAVPWRLDEVPAVMGITDTLEHAQAVAAQAIAAGKGFLAQIDEVEPRMAMGPDLVRCYLPAARTWCGRLSLSGDMRWSVL